LQISHISSAPIFEPTLPVIILITLIAFLFWAFIAFSVIAVGLSIHRLLPNLIMIGVSIHRLLPDLIMNGRPRLDISVWIAISYLIPEMPLVSVSILIPGVSAIPNITLF